jgi:hypothetical protein
MVPGSMRMNSMPTLLVNAAEAGTGAAGVCV